MLWRWSLAGQGAPSLPSVGVSQQAPSSSALQDEVFNIIPGTVNQHRGAAQYSSQDQAFSFQKQVRFEPGSSPDLGSATSPDPELQPQSSTPHHVPQPNPTFDVSRIPFQSGVQDAATIAVEVSAAAAVQASKEFWHMWEPKITKLKGGYSADAELVFRSWQANVLVHIQDCKLDNQAVIQLIKDQTQDSARHEVEFQLDLCGSDIPYKELLEHLSVAFQGSDDEANVLAEFYSHAQKVKELEEAFTDELQLLTWKVISMKPEF